jgi:hypothetical protein
MPAYRTEHVLPGLAESHLRAVTAALSETGRRLRLKGRDVALLRCEYVSQRLVCRFEAPTADDVRDAINLAQLPMAAVLQIEPQVP